MICTFIFECPFCFVLLVHRLLPTFMALCLDFAVTIRRFYVFSLKFNMLVKRHSDFTALGFFNGVHIIGTLWVLYVNPSGVDSIAASTISLIFYWSSHLPACWYILFILLIHMFSKEDLVNDDCSIPIVSIWSSRRDDCDIHLIATHCCSYVSIDRIEWMALFHILDLTHWVAWGCLLLTCKHKYYLPTGGNFVVFCNSTGAIDKVVFNFVKRGV